MDRNFNDHSFPALFFVLIHQLIIIEKRLLFLINEDQWINDRPCLKVIL